MRITMIWKDFQRNVQKIQNKYLLQGKIDNEGVISKEKEIINREQMKKILLWK